jgi:crotonobetainyl-CoA:carnitine CoA-transferase CaiB-like acyl-CoA transferase
LAQNPPPLQGIRVLDLSRVLAGPWCTMTLGDLGAEVIKIENPGSGDDTRQWGTLMKGGERTYYLACNRNKRSVAVDLANPEGQAIIRDLAAQSDVFIENFKLGGLDKYGLSYEALSKLNPKLIYCSISGYGRTGPGADRAGYDFIIQGESGLMSITGERDDLPGGGPQKVGVAVSDLMTGMYATQAILAAIIARGVTGKGQFIDMALYDCVLANLANMGSYALNTGEAPIRYGNAHQDVVPYQIYPTSDGEIIVAVGNNIQFDKLCRNVLERPDLADDARYKTNPLRMKNRDPLNVEIAREMKKRTREEWFDLMRKYQVPGGALQNVVESFGSPYAQARNMVYTIPHPTEGSVKVPGSPLKLTDTPVREPMAPPTLGQHTDEVLAEKLKLSPERIKALREKKAVA